MTAQQLETAVPEVVSTEAVPATTTRRQLGARHFVRGLLALGLGQVFTWFGSLILTVMLPRYLGDVGLGKYSFGLAVTGMIGLVTALGTGYYVVRQVARDEAGAPRLIAAVLAFRLPASAVVATLTALSFQFLPIDPVLRLTTQVLCLCIVLASFDVMTSGLQGLHQMKAMAISSTFAKLVLAALTAAVLLVRPGPAEVAVAGTAATALSAAFTTYLLSRHMRLTIRIERSRVRAAFLGGLPFLIWDAAWMVYSQIDVIMLTVLATTASVGWYNAAWRIINIPVVVPLAIMTIAYPALSASVKDSAAFNTIARRACHAVLVAGVPIALGMMLLPDRLTGILQFPAAFSNSWWPIVCLAPAVPLFAFDTVLGSVLYACDRQRPWAMAAVAAAILNPLANLLAIPYAQRRFGNGAIGAAVVTTLTEVFLMVVGLRLLPRGVFDRTTLLGSLKIVASTLPMVAVVLLTRTDVVFVPIVLGGIAYGLTCLLTGVVTRADLALVRDQLLIRASRNAR